MYYTRTNRTKLNHLLNYNQSFGIHDVSAMVGYEEETYNYRETNVSKLGLTDAAVNDLDAATTPYSTAGYGTEYAARSGVADVLNYAYKSGICLSLTCAMMVRRDLLPIIVGALSLLSRLVGV